MSEQPPEPVAPAREPGGPLTAEEASPFLEKEIGLPVARISLTAYEDDMLTEARRIVDELNVNLAGRGSPVMFTVVTIGTRADMTAAREIREAG